MAHTGTPRKRSGFSCLLTLFLIAAVTAGLAWLWLEMGRAHSLTARVAGTIYVMTPHAPGVVESIEVRNGQRVRQGQQLARIRSVSGHDDLARYAQSPKEQQKPTREQEEQLRKVYEDKVLQHVQAQLQRRDMDTQGGREAVGATAYSSAVQREQTTDAEILPARDAYEETSLARAGRGRRSGQGQTHASSMSPSGEQGWLHIITCQAQGNNVLLAPIDGHIASIAAQRGQMLLLEDTVMVLLPESRGTAPLRVTAEFSPRDADKVDAGDMAIVRSASPPLTLHGTVQEVIPADDGQSLLVHMQFPPLPEGVLSPGQEVSCVVHGHSILGFSEF